MASRSIRVGGCAAHCHHAPASPVAAQSVYRYTGKLAGFTAVPSHGDSLTINCPDPATQPCIAIWKSREGLHDGTIELDFPAVIPVVNVDERTLAMTPETPINISVESDLTFFKRPLSEPTAFSWVLQNRFYTSVGSSVPTCSQQTEVATTATTFPVKVTLPCTIGALGSAGFRPPATGSRMFNVSVSASGSRPGQGLYGNFFTDVRVTYGFTPLIQGPSVSAISPGGAQNNGDTGEPLKATITGSGFVQGAAVTIGNVVVNAVQYKSATQLEVDLGGDSVTKTLSAGTHTITLTATDSSGNQATDAITVTVVEPPSQPDETRFVPIVLATAGVGGSFFTSELTLRNRGTKDATVEITYTKALGEGAGVAYDVIPAGQQKIVPDALAYLAEHGVTLPVSGNRGGTLTVKLNGLSAPAAGSATVRTATPVTDGRAGLSYPAIPQQLLTGPSPSPASGRRTPTAPTWPS